MLPLSCRYLFFDNARAHISRHLVRDMSAACLQHGLGVGAATEIGTGSTSNSNLNSNSGSNSSLVGVCNGAGGRSGLGGGGVVKFEH